MSIIRLIKQMLVNRFSAPKKEMEPADAYNLWASNYDEQTNNLLIYLDELVFNSLLDNANAANKLVVDIGCGTGRHWSKILARKPSGLVGYDVSQEMLHKLRQKYPEARTYLLQNNELNELGNTSCDLVVSTLVIQHIRDLEEAFSEWNRILRKDGEVIITDFHPAAMKRGDSCSFYHGSELVFIKNYIHAFDKVRALARQMRWQEISLSERIIDHSVKQFYQDAHADKLYKASYGTPVLYGLHFRKIE